MARATSSPNPARPDRGTDAERQLIRSLGAWTSLPSPARRQDRLATAGAALLALSVVAPWRSTDAPIGLVGLGRPGLLVVAALAALVVAPLRRGGVAGTPVPSVVAGLAAGLGALLVTSTSSDWLPFASVGRLVALVGAAALVGSGAGRVEEAEVPSLGIRRDQVAEPLTHEEAERYAGRLAERLPRPSTRGTDAAAQVALVASGLAAVALSAPWRARAVPLPDGGSDGPQAVNTGAALLGTGRTAIVVAAVVLAWLVAAAVGARRAAPALVLAGGVLLGAVVHVGRLHLGAATSAPHVVVLASVAVVLAAAAVLARSPGRARALAVVALLPAVAVAAGGGAPGPGRDGPFTVISDGSSVAVDGAPARSVGGHGLVAWWDGDRPGALSERAADPDDDGIGDGVLAWSVRDGRVDARRTALLSDPDLTQVIGGWAISSGFGAASITSLDDPELRGCCADGFAVDRQNQVWSFQTDHDVGSYRLVPSPEVGRVDGSSADPPTPRGTRAIVAGDDGPFFVVDGTRLVDPRKSVVLFDAEARCGTPGAGLGPASMSELGPVVGDGDGGLWLAGRSASGGTDQLLVHRDAKGVVKRIARRLPDIGSLAVNDRGDLLVESDGRLLELDRPTRALVALGSAARCVEPDARVAGALRTSPAGSLAQDVGLLEQSYPPIVLGADGATLGYPEGEDALAILPRSGGPLPVDLGDDPVEAAVVDGAGGAWVLQGGRVAHVLPDGSVQPLAGVPAGTTSLGATSAGQVPPLLGGTGDLLDRATVDGLDLPASVVPGRAPDEVVRTRSGSLVVVSDGQILRRDGDRWALIAGPQEPDDHRPERATIAALLAGEVDAGRVRLDPSSAVLPDPDGDGVVFVAQELLVRVDAEGRLTAIAQDERLRGAQLFGLGPDLVVLDAFGRAGRVEAGA